MIYNQLIFSIFHFFPLCYSYSLFSLPINLFILMRTKCCFFFLISFIFVFFLAIKNEHIKDNADVHLFLLKIVKINDLFSLIDFAINWRKLGISLLWLWDSKIRSSPTLIFSSFFFGSNYWTHGWTSSISKWFTNWSSLSL